MTARMTARLHDLATDYESAVTLAKKGHIVKAQALIADLDDYRAEFQLFDEMFLDKHGEINSPEYATMSIASFTAHAYAGFYQA